MGQVCVESVGFLGNLFFVPQSHRLNSMLQAELAKVFFEDTSAHYRSWVFVARIKHVLRHFDEVCKHSGSDQALDGEKPASCDFRSDCPQNCNTLVGVTWSIPVSVFFYL